MQFQKKRFSNHQYDSKLSLLFFNHNSDTYIQEPTNPSPTFLWLQNFWQPFKCTGVSMHNQKHVKLERFVVVLQTIHCSSNALAYLTSSHACAMQKASE
jgi:hypothetical protein